METSDKVGTFMNIPRTELRIWGKQEEVKVQRHAK